MKIYETNADGYVFMREDGSVIVLSYSDVRDIKNLLEHDQLHEDIGYALDDIVSDGWIDIDKYDGTREEFIQEVYDCIGYDADYTPYPSEEYIRESILDTARDYDMEV